MVKEAIDLMENGAITFNEEDEEYDTMVSAMSKQVDTMIIHGNVCFICTFYVCDSWKCVCTGMYSVYHLRYIHIYL